MIEIGFRSAEEAPLIATANDYSHAQMNMHTSSEYVEFWSN